MSAGQRHTHNPILGQGLASGHSRTLIYFPIVHTQADMGALKAPVVRATMEKLGRAGLARHLAALFNPILYPGVGQVLHITQQELAYLVGLSRQRVNEALNALAAQGAIRVEYGGLRVLDLAALRAVVFTSSTGV